MTTQYRYDPDGIGAMPTARSGVLRTEPCSTVSALRAPATIAGPSRSFLSLTRNPDLVPPARFEPTVKAVGDIVL